MLLRPATGAEVEAQVAKVAATPKPVLEEAARVLEWKDGMEKERSAWKFL
jgi:hypothetical protein